MFAGTAYDCTGGPGSFGGSITDNMGTMGYIAPTALLVDCVSSGGPAFSNSYDYTPFGGSDCRSMSNPGGANQYGIEGVLRDCVATNVLGSLVLNGGTLIDCNFTQGPVTVGVDNTQQPCTMISSITSSGATATATFAGKDYLFPGDYVTISGATGADASLYNGTFQVVSTPSPTTITYTMGGTPGGDAAGTLIGYWANRPIVILTNPSSVTDTISGGELLDVQSGVGTQVSISSTVREDAARLLGAGTYSPNIDDPYNLQLLPNVKPGSVEFYYFDSDNVLQTITDSDNGNGTGTLSCSPQPLGAGTNEINYATGNYSFTLASAPGDQRQMIVQYTLGTATPGQGPSLTCTATVTNDGIAEDVNVLTDATSGDNTDIARRNCPHAFPSTALVRQPWTWSNRIWPAAARSPLATVPKPATSPSRMLLLV